MHVSARVAPVGEAFRQVRNMQGDEVFFSLYNTGGVSDHHPRLENIMKIQRQWYFTPASLAPTSPASSTSLLFSLKTLSLASPRQWGWMMQQQDSFRCHVIRELSKIFLLVTLLGDISFSYFWNRRLLRRPGHWDCLGISPLERIATCACATAPDFHKSVSCPKCFPRQGGTKIWPALNKSKWFWVGP